MPWPSAGWKPPRSGREAAMRYVLVNGRMPRSESSCAMCCKAIGETYLRELTTRLTYCDPKCYVAHRSPAVPAYKATPRALWR